MLTKLFLTVCAGQAAIRIFRKPLREKAVQKLPLQQEQQGHAENTPTPRIYKENERRKHHCVIPIIDTAIGTAFAAQYPRLEGTEEEHANHIAHPVRKADKDEYPLVEYPYVVQNPKRSVERKPKRRR